MAQETIYELQAKEKFREINDRSLDEKTFVIAYCLGIAYAAGEIGNKYNSLMQTVKELQQN